MDVPSYTGGSITRYLRKVEKYRVKLQEEKYNLLLDFINEWLNYPQKLRLKSFTEFKNLKESYLLKDLKYNRKILRKYSDDIIKKLSVTFNVDDQTDSDEIKDRYILYFLQRALSSLDYSLSVKDIDGENYYTIKFKPN